MTIGMRWFKILEDNPVYLMDRVKDLDGDVVQARINSVSFRVFRYPTQSALLADSDGTEVGTSATLTVSDVIYDTLQNDTLWQDAGGNPDDGHGYNSFVTIPAARFPNALEWYGVEVTYTPPAGDAYKIKWGGSTNAVAGT